MLSQENFTDLKVKGYTVVKDVITEEECDHAIGQYREWLSNFKGDDWPYSANSLIQRYNVGNMEPSWYVRLKSKKVFAQVWQTDKLLSSVDAIAIGRPPEDGVEPFYRPGEHWLHLDQCSAREGLHAYQGAVYLETADEDDWTLYVIEGSHLHFEEFFKNNARAAIRSETYNYYSLLDEDVKYFARLGCTLKRVAVPKGGMVLWESRLVHANAEVMKGRKNPGRWRYCVFVSMTPAIWANEEDLIEKKEAYENVCMTTHWSSQEVMSLKTYIPSYAIRDPKTIRQHSEIAKTCEAKLLCGAITYDFRDGKPNGDTFYPKWNDSSPRSIKSRWINKAKLGLCVIVGVVSVAGIVYVANKVRNK